MLRSSDIICFSFYPLRTWTDDTMFIEYSVGDFVTHPQKPDWGTGQVQSVIGSRITVNFEHAGKQLINAELISLTPVADKIDLATNQKNN